MKEAAKQLKAQIDENLSSASWKRRALSLILVAGGFVMPYAVKAKGWDGLYELTVLVPAVVIGLIMAVVGAVLTSTTRKQ